MRFLSEVIRAFKQGWRDADPRCMSRLVKNKEDHAMRERLSDKQLDRMLKETFPSSDPVAMY